MRRSPMPPRRTSLPRSSSPLRRTPLAAVSPKRRRQLREYTALRAAFLAGHPRCQFPAGCDARAVVVHHKRGREGERLNDTDWWAASCAFHNDFAETRTGEALAIGWLQRIEGAA